LAERAVIRPGDLDELGWKLHSEYNEYPLPENASSCCEVDMFTNNVSDYVFVISFDSVDRSSAYFQGYLDRLDDYGNNCMAEPLDAGDEGVLILRTNGNGTCSLSFYQENLFVWMDLVNLNYRGGGLVTEEFVVELALELCHAQEMKFSSVLIS